MAAKIPDEDSTLQGNTGFLLRVFETFHTEIYIQKSSCFTVWSWNASNLYDKNSQEKFKCITFMFEIFGAKESEFEKKLFIV